MITLTDWEMSTLKCAAAAGKSFRFACEEIHRAPKTVDECLEQMGLHDIRDRFARSTNDRTDGKIMVIDLDALRKQPARLPETPQAYWLAQPWRSAS